MQADAYEDEHEELQNDNHKVKNQNLYLETTMHDLRLEHEKHSRLFSSSFYHLGMIQVQKEQVAKKGVKQGDQTDMIQADWIDSQRDNVYAHSYEMVLKHP